MEEKELAIWKGIHNALYEPIQNKILWKPECMKCDRYDRIENTGCLFDKCKFTGESTWIK